jgi:hypothetical protein
VKVPLLDYLFQAMTTEHGLILQCENPAKLRAALYREQKKLPELHELSLFISPTNPQGELWIVKGKKDAQK